MSNSSLKEANKKSIWILIVIDIVAFIFLINDLSLDFFVSSFFSDKSTAIPLIASVVGPLIAGVLNGLIPSRVKDKMVFWRRKNVLPGHRAFSEIIHNDPRINIEKLKKVLGGFPKNGKEQNTLWYSIYVKHRDVVSVNNSHQYFLLYRDFTAITFLLSFIAIAIVTVYHFSLMKILILVGLCITQYFVFMILARNMGIRFVENVIAEELAMSNE